VKKVGVWQLWIAMALVMLFGMLHRAQAQEDFLAPEEAFVFSAAMSAPNQIRLHFDIADGYYMYRDRLGFSSQPTDASAVLGEPVLPAGEVKYDPTFDEDMEVYHKALTISLPLNPMDRPLVMDLAYQGCADAGLCYPPMTHQIALEPAAEGWRITGWGADGQAIKAAGAVKNNRVLANDGTARANVESSNSVGGLGSLFSANDMGLADAMSALGGVKTVLVFFVLGILLALTPCVLPMIPILSAMVVRDGAGKPSSRLRGFTLALAYVAGMSVVYTALGVAAGLSGVGLAAWLQKPWVLVLFASMLTVLALATFGAFTFQMPAAIQARLSAGASRTGRGRLSGAVLMGAISALIVGPCVAAPLAGALLYISQSGDVWLGGAALFGLSWGMGVPLLVVGASSTAWLPKAGAWMNGVTRLFGMLLLATAWYMVSPVVPTVVQMVGWGLLFIVGGVMLGFAGQPAGQPMGTLQMFGRGIALVLLLIGLAQIVGALSGGRDLLSPLSHFSNASVQRDLTRILNAPPSPVAATPVDPISSGTSRSPLGGLGERDANSILNGLTGSRSGAASSVPGGPSTPAGSTGPAANQRVLPDSGLTFTLISSVDELDRALARSDRPVLLDFYADWCVSCHEMERFTFGDPAVAAKMAGFTLLQADVTANNADHRALLKRFNLFGPPGIMFFDAEGQYLREPRVIGFQNATRFMQALNQAATP